MTEPAKEPAGAGERLPFFGAPPARVPLRAKDVPALRGKRVILSTAEGFVYDMRAVSQIQRDRDGRDIVDIATEEGYFRWMFTGERPATTIYPARLVWVE
jgi:hypothetical protein